jgi:CP family cyanate transporter-like MFS transporter
VTGRPDRALPAAALITLFGLIGLNLRTTFGAVPAVLDDIGRDQHLTGFALSLLTSIPLVAMGILAPPAQRLAARIGHEQLTALSLALLTAAEALRLGARNTWILYLATILVGVAMGGASTVMPGLIGHYLVRSPGLGAGVYSMTGAVGSTAAAWVTVPFVASLGGWPRSLAVWAAPSAMTTVCWLMAMRRLREHPPKRPAGAAADLRRLPWGSRTAWLLATYFAIQALLGFSGITWVAPAYRARGWGAHDADILLSTIFAVQIIGMLVLPAITDRCVDRRPLLFLSLGSTALGLLCFAAVPSLAYPGTVLFGLGLGGGFALGLVLLGDVTTTRGDAARLSALVFLLSYTLASAGPPLVGVLHDMTRSYAPGFWLLFALALVHLTCVPAFCPGRRM